MSNNLQYCIRLSLFLLRQRQNFTQNMRFMQHINLPHLSSTKHPIK